MDISPYLITIAAVPLAADALRRVYAVGKTANDHFVAAVVTGCMGFYVLMSLSSPAPLRPFWLWGALGIWGLFFSIHRDEPPSPWVRWLLAYPSQPAYAFALWGGLIWLLRAPFALWSGGDVWWPDYWLIVPLVLTTLGTWTCYRGGRATRHTVD